MFLVLIYINFLLFAREVAFFRDDFGTGIEEI